MKIYLGAKTIRRDQDKDPIPIVYPLLVQTKLSKSLTLDNGTDYGDLPFHAAQAITIDGCIRLMQTKAAH